MRISEASIREVNARTDAAAVVADYVKLEKRSGRYWGCCPFHNEKTPSFTVDSERRLYYCFGCHKGGTVLDFVMEMDKLSFPEAVTLLARKAGVSLVYEDSGYDRAEVQGPSRKDDLYGLYGRIAGSFHHLLCENQAGQAAKRYILDRGISAEMLETFRLGYAPPDRYWLYRFLSGKGYSAELLAASGLFSRNYPEVSLFSGRLIFPVSDRQGRTVAFGGRILEEAWGGEGGSDAGTAPAARPKYINSPETEIYRKGQTLFAIDLALPDIRASKAAYLAEGYMDVIALHQAGVKNAVAPLGTAFTEDQAKLLARWAETVCLIFDADEAGQNAMVKAILLCRKCGLSVKVCIPGRGLSAAGGLPERTETSSGPALPAKSPKDPADILKEFGVKNLKNAVKYDINDFEYLVERAAAGFDLAGPSGKAAAADFLFPWAEAQDTDVARASALEAIADAIGAERESLRADFRRHTARGAAYRRQTAGGGAGSGAPASGGTAASGPVRTNSELFLLAAVFVNPWLYAKFRSVLPVEELEDSGARELYIALEEWFRNDVPASGIPEAGLPPELLGRIADGSLRNYVLEQNAGGAFSVHPEKMMEDGIRQVRKASLRRRQREIVVELRSRKDGEVFPGRRSLDDLLAEKKHLDEEILRLKEYGT